MNIFFVALLMAVTVCGCSTTKPQKNLHSSPARPQTIVTPDLSLEAKVISVNTAARFVVLNFPPGQMPKLQQTLFIYHAGLKVGEVKITGPRQDSNIVADLISGNAQTGDVVRNQ